MLIDWQKAFSSLISSPLWSLVLDGVLAHHQAVLPELLEAPDQVEAAPGFAGGEAAGGPAGGQRCR
jgi:hypothetical protein